ncbi:sugar ABC transporter permease, partial [Streptomyces sp. SID6013]|nr:sugar ABC transporter permease [Streptomyces sp. SID6013]
MSTYTTGRRPPGTTGTPPAPRRTTPRSPREHTRATVRQRLTAGGFMAPAVLLVTLFLLAPFVWTVYRSFFSDTRTAPFSWFENYS